MATTSRSASNGSQFAGYFLELPKIGDDDLGEFYRARTAEQKPTLVLKFYNWVGDLPAEQHKKLNNALAEWKQKLAHRLLLPINTFHVGPPQNNIYENYVEFTQAEAVVTLAKRPRELLSERLDYAVDFVRTLAGNLASLHEYATQQKVDWLRPNLKAEKLWLIGAKDGMSAVELLRTLRIALPDLGLAVWLVKPETKALTRSAVEEQAEIKALGLLLLQLLREPAQFAKELRTTEEIRQAQNEVAARYPVKYPLLNDFFSRALYPQQNAPYRNLAEIVAALLGLIPGEPSALIPVAPAAQPVPSVQSSTTPPPTATPAGQRAISIAQATPNVQTQAVSPPDELLIEYIAPGAQDKPSSYHLSKDAAITLGGGVDDQVRLKRIAPRRLLLLYQNGRRAEQYLISDTGTGRAYSDQPALLDGIPLSPYFAAIFHENSRLEIDQYRLRLKLTRLTANPLTSPNSRPLQVTQTRYAGNPGAALQVQATIRNVTREVDSFWLAIDGAVENMHFELPEPQRLFEEDSVTVLVTIYLPVLHTSTAGEVPLILRLISENYRVQVAALRISVTILPQYDFSSSLLPELLRLGDDGNLVIENQGNLTRNFVVQWRDRAQELDFVPPDATITVPAQSAVDITYRAYIRKRQWRLLGRPHFHTMNVLVQPRGGGAPQMLSGQVVSRALIPGWAPIAALLLLLLFLFVATFLFQPEFAHPATVYAIAPSAAPNAAAGRAEWLAAPTPFAGTPFSLLWQPVGSCFYSVYENDAITKGPQFNFTWSSGVITYPVNNLNAGTIVEVRLRSCMLLGERSWKVVVQPLPQTTPTPTATVTPAILVSDGVVVYRDEQMLLTPPPSQRGEDGITRLLVGQLGELCFAWQAIGVDDSLMIVPNLQLDVTGARGQYCLPIAEYLRATNGEVAYALAGKQGEQEVLSAPFARVEVRQPLCRVNIDVGAELAIREGPGRNFPERGRLRKDEQVLALARPFAPMEQGDGLEWLFIALLNDPRPAWVAYREGLASPDLRNEYLACPQDLRVLPAAGDIPATPTPTPTTTPEPTVTPTATPASEVSLEPAVINPGGCAMLKWKIENVKEVYLNDEGVIGEGEREVCPTGAGQYSYEWRIIKTDDSIYKITKILTVNPGPPGTPAPPTPPE